MVIDRLFDIRGRSVVITGAAGLLGSAYAKAIAAAGGIPVLLDVDERKLGSLQLGIESAGGECLAVAGDLTDPDFIYRSSSAVRDALGPVWGLVNNVSSNPPMGPTAAGRDRLERFSVEQWNRDLNLGLTTAALCAQTFGAHMQERGAGSIVNIASDLAVIAPDQRIYRRHGENPLHAAVKPMSYSVVKAGLLGLTRYLATYWAPLPIRSNALLPGSVQSTQGPELVANLIERIPLGRLATEDEYSGAVLFLLSDASSYMTGAMLTMDGGRSAW